MSRPVRVAYIGGFGRSGSTLLELALGSLPGVCALGELVHLWERGLRDDENCGCGRRFSACPFWREVGQQAFGGWDEVDVEKVLALKHRVDRNRFVPRLLAPRLPPRRLADVRAYADLYVAVYRAALDITEAQVVVDSSKHVSLLACLRRHQELDLRLVHVVRDSRGVAHSWGKRVRRPEIVDSEAYMPQYSPTQASALWMAHNAMFEAVAAAGTPRLFVRYEDFAQTPGETLATVARYAGLPLPSAPSPGDDDLLLRPNHTVAGNPMRFHTGRLAVRADDEWRTAMAPGRRRVVSALTLPLRARYGYLEPLM
jgi:hypothetical protein